MSSAVRASREVLEPASSFRVFPLDEYEERWSRVHEEMKNKGYDVAVVWGKTSGVYERSGDMLYLTNFFSTHSGQEPDTELWNGRSYSAVIMQQGQVPELITDEAEARFDVIATDRFQGLYDPIKGVADTLRSRGIDGKVALVGSDFLPMKYWLQLQDQTRNIEWITDDDLVRNVRRLKSANELALFREAGELVTRAHIPMMEALIAGKTEGEAAGMAGKILLEGGGSWHRIAISHGNVSQYLESDPVTGFSTLAPNKGEIVHGFIYGPILKGYWLDPGRTAVCGTTPTSEQKHLYESLVDMMHRLMDKIKPGVKVKDVALLGDELSEASGYASEVLKTNWPYYGHSNGCMWERPYIEPRLCTDAELFEENMVASVEGFFDKEGVGTAVFETNYIVTKDGVDEITPVPHLWW
ncbi:MAG: M24 family metallopeptidase [Gammaproteobacteria bacterium]|nr:M24 family metallopeptidase [Gammaproteobacteria bacterium]